jgi:hypothetical protein
MLSYADMVKKNLDDKGDLIIKEEETKAED